MPHRRRRNGRKSKFVTKRGLPFQMMKYVETKFQTLNATDVSCATFPGIGPQFAAVNLIEQGVQQDERIGNMVQLSGIYIRLIHEATNPALNQWLRVTLTSPRDVNGGSRPISDMTTPVDPDLHKVWYDKTHNSAFQPGGGNGVVTIRKKFKPYLKVLYNDDTVTSITQGNVQLTFISKNDLQITASYTARVYFKDM